LKELNDNISETNDEVEEMSIDLEIIDLNEKKDELE